jgi:putative cardiolipin synthase
MRYEVESPLVRAIRPQAESHGDRSGILPLGNGHDAFAARVLLASAASRTLDVRCYIWRGDTSGSLLAGALLRAAERGVRVRLLLDDNNTIGLDGLLSVLDAHPKVEVRLFNPFSFRRRRVLAFLTDFVRLNRRMHNKSFTADGQATILGGRNVGDEYFDMGDDVAFTDLDVLAVGPVVEEEARDFERYWACPSSRPASGVLPRATAESIATGRDALLALPDSPAAEPYTRAVADSTIVRSLLDADLPFEWAPARLISDDPAKAEGRARPGGLVWPTLERILGSSTRDLHLVSAYFVPTATGVDALTSLASRGVRVRVLTNALEATDVGAVHAGYAKRRLPLLRAGVRLFEMRREYAPKRTRIRRRGRKGSSRVTLHAKTFAVDGTTVFLGSFNFDPRSAALNTEMGVIVECPELARGIAEAFETAIPEHAYEVRLAHGSLRWIERTDGKEVVLDREPGAGLPKRILLRVLEWLPVEWLL